MRTAVVRIDVDPAGRLTPAELASGMAALRELAGPAGIEVIDTDVAAMPARRRQVHLLIAGTDPENVEAVGIELCAKAFGSTPTAGVTTYVSRGTDDDAYGVLAAFGLTGEIHRSAGADGLDVVCVTLREADLDRIPESRIHTALEAALNYQVRIQTT
ncbi:MAG TPA: hypothetical protein VFQ37_18020 [Mycobacterium sp.]|nr:hypothetical protein [Mycobacterium sp.]